MRSLLATLAVTAVILPIAGCSGGEPVAMPDVVGKRLDVAKSDMKRAGYDDDVEVLGGGTFGVIDESNWTVCSQEPEAGTTVTDSPRITVDRTCDPTDDEPTNSGNSAGATEDPEAETYSYQGPRYEIVTVDEDVSNAGLNQYWVYTSKLDYSTDAFKDQVKMIITDIAHKEKTPKLIVQVVTDKEIIQAESNSTIADFMDEKGPDYFKSVIAPKEKTDWVAWYTGGFDPDTAQPSESAAAFEIAWLPEKVQGNEKWKPKVEG
jgi:beta-lactam-binding protein with PASTA domain